MFTRQYKKSTPWANGFQAKKDKSDMKEDLKDQKEKVEETAAPELDAEKEEVQEKGEQNDSEKEIPVTSKEDSSRRFRCGKYHHCR